MKNWLFSSTAKRVFSPHTKTEAKFFWKQPGFSMHSYNVELLFCAVCEESQTREETFLGKLFYFAFGLLSSLCSAKFAVVDLFDDDDDDFTFHPRTRKSFFLLLFFLSNSAWKESKQFIVNPIDEEKKITALLFFRADQFMCPVLLKKQYWMVLQ